MPKKETKVYIINCNSNFDFREKEKYNDYDTIMTKAEELGTVYSLQGFQKAINNEELSLSNSFIYISNK